MATPLQHDPAYRRVKSTVDNQYPRGWFVAVANDRVLAAAADFHTVEEQLRARAIDPGGVRVIESGVEYPETVTSFI